jgi:hypothetical protein
VRFLKKESAHIQRQIAQAAPGETAELLRRKGEVMREIQGLKRGRKG